MGVWNLYAASLFADRNSSKDLEKEGGKHATANKNGTEEMANGGISW